jgi:hypothetical protein
MTTVQVKRPEDTKLADWFAELRLWFDNNDCNPILFTEVAGRFNIKFAEDIHAQLFATTFAKYGPSIRHPIAEPTEIDMRYSDIPFVGRRMGLFPSLSL